MSVYDSCLTTSNACCTWIGPQQCIYKHQDTRTYMYRQTVTSVGRRLLSELVLVHTSIKAADVKAGDAIASSLTTDRINGALENVGLPKATINQTPTVETVSTAMSVNTSSTVSSTTALLIGGIVGDLVLLTVVTMVVTNEMN